MLQSSSINPGAELDPALSFLKKLLKLSPFLTLVKKLYLTVALILGLGTKAARGNRATGT